MREPDNFPGVYRAVVTDGNDPKRRGRIQIAIPAVSASERAWAPVVVSAAGARASFERGDEVLVAFEAGDPRSPFVLGKLWDSSDRPPESLDPGR
jgi:uncharacterized protein involved in type VI secretion and phage assembly